jgi:NAD(P)-dependent dehydrogenase (short-subunit alcohol dehydrogenase family)
MTGLFDLTGKVAIITGSTKGIGLGIARRFAEHGARVVVSSRRQEDCEAVAREINDAMGGEVALPLAGDLADPASLERLANGTVAKWGTIDTLVLNAAKADIVGLEAETSPEDFSEMLTVNVVNNFRLANAVRPHMQARGGSVLFISSIAGTGPSLAAAVYGVCKRALLQLVDNLALEWCDDNIRVNAIAPGLTVSEATRPLWNNPQVRSGLSDGIPLGRFGEADDIAACAIYLASDGGAYVTGQTFVIDGGMTLRGAANRKHGVSVESAMRGPPSP